MWPHSIVKRLQILKAIELLFIDIFFQGPIVL